MDLKGFYRDLPGYIWGGGICAVYKACVGVIYKVVG